MIMYSYNADTSLSLSDDKKAVSNFMGCLPLSANADGTPNPDCPYTYASPSNLLPIKVFAFRYLVSLVYFSV